ncbi:MAG: peptidoglycan editing factor PgeF [Magnetococcales bacterium]|nr:peptidoglycan editing factor PgeF [Magnetococcales bacterium]
MEIAWNSEDMIVHHPAIPQLPGIGWFFTTRQGGVSTGEFDSWNLGHHVGDDPVAVTTNRQRLAQRLGVTQVCYLNQVHGTVTHTVTTPPDTLPDGDAWATRQPQLPLAIMVADCLPVLLADSQNRVIGAAHAGWRGAADGVVESCLQAMEQLGAKRDQVQAILGPCIRQASYEVGEGFRQQLLQQDGAPGVESCFISHQNSLHFDLPGYVHLRLMRQGIPAERIYDVELCTYVERNAFFSYRRTTHHTPAGQPARCGRQVGGIVLL